MQFLPLMLNSLFSATFNICWIAKLYYNELTHPKEEYQALNNME
jgi:hypothetical protein